ncbi:MAG: coenzyme F420-0:L-glutamate ligase, partial [bacterium]|nr:coenzyme F420-0:L-glutamate ligase [bacterium]
MQLNSQRCGTIVMGVKTPFIMRGDDLVKIVTENVLAALGKENIADGDIIAVTEAVVAIAQNNIFTKQEVAAAIKKLVGSAETMVILWPIFSRNRFAPILDCLALAMQGKKIIIQLNAFIDEQGNNLFSQEIHLKPGQRGLTEAAVRQNFGNPGHVITGVDYLDLYRKIGEKRGAQVEIVCSNEADFVQDKKAVFMVSCVHGRDKTKELLQKKNYPQVFTLQDVCADHCEYGLLGA